MIGYALSVWAVAAVGGYLPYVVGTLGTASGGEGAGGDPWLSVLNVFSGGVFIAAGFMHLLPDAEEGLHKLSAEWRFQFAPFFASLAFILMFLLEELVAHVSSSLYPPYACTPSNGHQHHHGAFFTNPAEGGGGGGRAGPPPPRPPTSGAATPPCYGYSVDENYHLFGSGTESGLPSPAAAQESRTKMEGGGGGSFAGRQLPVPLPLPLPLPRPGLDPCSAGGGGGGGGGGASLAARAAAAGERLPLAGGAAAAAEAAGAADAYRKGAAGGEWVGDAGGTGVVLPGGNGVGGAAQTADNGSSIGLGSLEASPVAAAAGGDLPWNAGVSGVHITSLREDGRGNGFKRLGSKGMGSYGAISQQSSPSTVENGGGWPRGLGEGGDAEQPCFAGGCSPAKSGEGPWIGRRLEVSEKLVLHGVDREERSLSAAVAGALASSGSGDKLRVGVGGYDDLHGGGGGGLRLHVGKETGGGAGAAGNLYPSKLGMTLGAVLSFHAVMEGLGLGASSASAAPGVFAAIVVHKGLAAFSLGCIFFSSDAPRLQYFLVMGVFSLLTPLGAAMGMLVRASSNGSSAGAGFCTALGAGTFIHVAAMEVLPRDLLHDARKKKTKIACLVGGYLTFAGLSRFV